MGLYVLHENGVTYFHEASAIAIRMALRTERGVVRRTEIVKNFGVGSARLTRGHILGHARAAPPILLGVVVENVTALHAEAVAVGFAPYLHHLGLYPLLCQKFFPDIGGFRVARHVIFLVANKYRHVQARCINDYFVRKKFKEPRQLLFLEIVAERPV